MTRPLVIAHRGSSGERPENTLPAFERAIEQSADMIETDLHLSRDGVVVIHHDAELERLGEQGEIRDRTATELAAMNAAPGAGVAEKMPTLLDILDGFGERMQFNLELKVGRDDAAYDGLEDIVVSAVEERGLMPRMLFSSFYDPFSPASTTRFWLACGNEALRPGLLCLFPRGPRSPFSNGRRGLQPRRSTPRSGSSRKNSSRKRMPKDFASIPIPRMNPRRWSDCSTAVSTESSPIIRRAFRRF